jgi:hypothetical protein
MIWLLCAFALPAWGQDAEVKRYVALVEEGKVEEVRQAVPGLLEQYPNNPGVLYVQALVTKEGADAARIYQSIVDNFPRSTYADASLYKVYQFYYALGLYRTAELKMAQLKRDYPSSRYLRQGGQETGALAEEIDSTRVPAPAVAPSVRPSEPAPAAPTAFSLQVGAYGARENAEKQKEIFAAKGYPVELITKVRESKTLHVVLVGRYTTYEEAKAKGAEIKKALNIEPMVISR